MNKSTWGCLIWIVCRISDDVQRRQELKQKQKQKQQEEEGKSQFRSSPMNEVVIRYQKVKHCDAAAAAGERGRARPCHAVHTDGFAAMQCNGCFCPPWTRTGEHLPMDQAKDVVLYNASEREKSTSFVCLFSLLPTSNFDTPNSSNVFITAVSVLVADNAPSIALYRNPLDLTPHQVQRSTL